MEGVLVMIRSSVCALIIRNNQILTIKKQVNKGIEYIMPGGGQDKNHENSERDKQLHIVNHIFSCEIEEERKYQLEPDLDQIGIEWLRIRSI